MVGEVSRPQCSMAMLAVGTISRRILAHRDWWRADRRQSGAPGAEPLIPSG
jgi:hypothetical protein